MDKATFAGGCFWCMQPAFENLGGVENTTVGYMGGEKKDPTYKEVSKGETGHREVIQIEYDSEKIDYEKLLEVFWKSIDPFDPEGQFADKGKQYKTTIFYHNENQKKMAEKSKRELENKFDKKVQTEIDKAGKFYKAEEYHQDYHKKYKIKYILYKKASGRKKRLKDLWDEKI